MWKNNGQNLGPYGGMIYVQSGVVFCDLSGIRMRSAYTPCVILGRSWCYLSIFLVFSGGVPRVVVV
jgi:hypothetical protein